jgi:hypothetical protein
MQDSPDSLHAADDAMAMPAPTGEEWGWYLYGITRRTQEPSDDITDITAGVSLETDDQEQPLEVIPSGELLAIVRRVPLARFTPEALRYQAEDPTWIETAARRHNAVLERIHRARTVLPAKFGSVYVSAEDVQTALRDEHDRLLERLNWLDGCDEWGVRLYGNLAAIRQRAETEQDSVHRLREELASASPGRAYFLRRKLADELASIAERLLDDLVEQAYERFARHAKAGQLSQRIAGSRISQDDDSAEILRAVFLTSREEKEAFIADLSAFAESQPGLWCEYSGPWPPYSFAARPTDAEPLEEA